MIENIERSILCSVLEYHIIGAQSGIIDVDLNANLFTVPFHKKIVSGINRLKQLNEPIDTDTLRAKFIEAKKWNMQEDYELLSIISHNPFGTLNMFNSYLSILNKNYKKRLTI